MGCACSQAPGPPSDGTEAAERPAEVEVRGIEAPKVPAGPMLRETTAALDIPDAVDELMREHLRFLYKEGGAPSQARTTEHFLHDWQVAFVQKILSFGIGVD